MSKPQELQTLPEIFNCGHRAFRVPDYQRGFSWGTLQVTDLLNDILHMARTPSQVRTRHFMGTIVAAKNNDSQAADGFEHYDLVDGQQRLTSLILLINEIHLHYRSAIPEAIQNLEQLFIKTKDEKGLNTIRLFKLNKEVDQFFASSIIEDIKHEDLKQNKSHANLETAKQIICTWCKSIEAEMDTIVDVVLNRLGFIFFAPENTNEIGIMFEVINNRGKPLSQLEKVKNYLIYLALKNGLSDLKNKVDDYWTGILNYLNRCDYTSNQKEDSFLQNAWYVFFPGSHSSNETVYDQLKTMFPASIPTDKVCEWSDTLNQLLTFMKGCALTYLKLFTGDHIEDAREKRLMTLIRLQESQSAIIPLILSLYETKLRSNEDRISILSLLEKLNFRFYGCNIARRSDSQRSTLIQWASGFYHGKYQSDELRHNLIWFVGQHASDISFIKNLTLDQGEAGDYYTWGSLKYFLANYEETLLEKENRSIDFNRFMAPFDEAHKNDFYDKEHIWALAEPSIVNDQANPDINKRRLGNFTLLEPTINRAFAGCHSVHDKIKGKYWIHEHHQEGTPEPNTLMMHELPEMYNHVFTEVSSRWERKTANFWYEVNMRFFDLRETKLVQFALNRWRVDYDGDIIEEVIMDSKKSGEKFSVLKKREKPMNPIEKQ